MGRTIVDLAWTRVDRARRSRGRRIAPKCWIDHPDGARSSVFLQAPLLLTSSPTPMSTSRRWLESLRAPLADRRGAAQTEYVVLVGTMGLAIVFALVTAGPALVRSFERTRDMVSSPFP